MEEIGRGVCSGAVAIGLVDRFSYWEIGRGGFEMVMMLMMLMMLMMMAFSPG